MTKVVAMELRMVEIREKEEQKILVTQAKARVQCWL
jgi:hypothetical protein